MAAVSYRQASRIHPGTHRPAVDALDLEIGDGEFLVLVGPSGCGKSTSLRMLAGLEAVDRGAILIGGEDVTGVAAKDRDIAMIFQNYALYPHMTVAENMGFALKVARQPASVIAERVRSAARTLDLEQYLDRKPGALSGGQRQRVAMGRAIVRQPRVFCMDEPLSNLDAKLRVSTRTEIAALQRRLGTTTVYVTHDQVEAMTMGDRVAILRDGVLQQVAPPKEVYERPANVFVAGFVGSPAMNLLPGTVRDGAVQVAGLRVAVPRSVVASVARANSPAVTLGVRPEDLRAVAPGNGLAVEVQLVEELGADSYIHTTAVVDGERHQVVGRVDRRSVTERGATLHLAPDPEQVHVFAGETGKRIGP